MNDEGACEGAPDQHDDHPPSRLALAAARIPPISRSVESGRRDLDRYRDRAGAARVPRPEIVGVIDDGQHGVEVVFTHREGRANLLSLHPDGTLTSLGGVDEPQRYADGGRDVTASTRGRVIVWREALRDSELDRTAEARRVHSLPRT